MDILLILFLTLVISFLITEAAIYIIRPQVLLSEEDGAGDILMWEGFIFSITMALVAVVIGACIIRGWYCSC